MGWGFRIGLGMALASVGMPASAQSVASVVGETARALQSPDEAMAQDAAAIGERFGFSAEEGAQQLRLQEASVAATDAIADRFAGRLTGIAIEHTPAFRIVVLLAGDGPVADETLDLAGQSVVVTYRTGARATHTELVQAIAAHQAGIRASLLRPPGMGIDLRTGELVVIVSEQDVAREGAPALTERLAALTRMPVRLRVVNQPTLDLGGIQGGARMVGSVPGDAHRYLCTSGFVVTDGSRMGLTTAAHCPDEMSIRDGDGHSIALPFLGQWGWGHQDVQINASPLPLEPIFFADTSRTISRAVTGSRSRAGMRAGDIVCHRGERTGYSCSAVELTDFAPAGDLCGGACLPTWTTVAGPVCKSGDSGRP